MSTKSKPSASQPKPASQPVASATKIQSPRLMTNSDTTSRLMRKQK